MKVDPKIIAALVKTLVIQYHRFPGTNAVVASASLPDGFFLGTGVGVCVDPKEFNLTLGKKAAKENALVVATNKLWEMEGMRLRFAMEATQPAVKAAAVKTRTRPLGQVDALSRVPARRAVKS